MATSTTSASTRLRRAALGRLDRRLDGRRLALASARHLVAELEGDALLPRMRCICRATSASMPGRMRSRNSTTVTSAPSRRQTEPSSRPMTPAPTTSSLFGTFAQRQRAGRGDDALLVDVDARQRRDVGAGGDDDGLACRAPAASPSTTVTSTLPGAGDAARRRGSVDLVLLAQERDAVGVALHALVLVGQHRARDRASGVDLDAHAGEAVAGLLEELGGVQQRLGGDAADVEAGAAVRRALLDDGDLQAELGGADGAHVAARAGADDDEIVGAQSAGLPLELQRAAGRPNAQT